jgi:uncharacterized OsmC-like protein
MREAFMRSEKALSIRPILGLKTARSRTVLEEGFRCEITEGRWTLTSDLGEKGGGTGAGPDPGVLARAALGSCLAMAYAQWAARMEVTLSRITIDVEADFDAGAQYGVSAAPPGFAEVRYAVVVVSPDPADKVREVIDRAERHCPNLDVFARAQPLVRSLTVLDSLPEEG